MADQNEVRRAQDAKINDLMSIHHRLDTEYSEDHKQFGDFDYNISCMRKDATRPTYKFSEYHQSRFTWQNLILSNYIAKRKTVYSSENERIDETATAKFRDAGFADIYERDNPARYTNSAPITFTDTHLDAIVEQLSGAVPDEKKPGWRDFFLKKTKAAFDEFERDPSVAAVKKDVKSGETLLVLGSMIPYFECVGLTLGAKPTSYGAIPINYSSGRVSVVDEDALKGGGQKFDHIVASFAIARAGLGIFEKDLDPNGDKAMLKLAAGVLGKGHLFVTLPMGPKALLYNAVRVYDDAAAEALFDGWDVVEQSDILFEPYDLYLAPEHRVKRGQLGFKCFTLKSKSQ